VRSDPAVQQLVQRAAELTGRPGRAILGITGPPAAGKTTLAETLLAELAPHAAYVPLDGFHLAHHVLQELGTAHRKGAPDTFDAAGYLALLRRLRDPGEGTVYAPQFRREIEDSLANAIPVRPAARLTDRHVRYGRDGAEAAARATGPDQRNAELIEATKPHADLIISVIPED